MSFLKSGRRTRECTNNYIENFHNEGFHLKLNDDFKVLKIWISQALFYIYKIINDTLNINFAKQFIKFFQILKNAQDNFLSYPYLC